MTHRGGDEVLRAGGLAAGQFEHGEPRSVEQNPAGVVGDGGKRAGQGVAGGRLLLDGRVSVWPGPRRIGKAKPPASSRSTVSQPAQRSGPRTPTTPSGAPAPTPDPRPPTRWSVYGCCNDDCAVTFHAVVPGDPTLDIDHSIDGFGEHTFAHEDLVTATCPERAVRIALDRFNADNRD
ncbi:hypothetical protein ACFZBU_40725 [Embleya sp. NPDC008237]|uniref:hypothetical protein n=1 Tax=Embleya sp. NPDC008237 TaxID=3363978 RepID=UPI0036E86EF2